MYCVCVAPAIHSAYVYHRAITKFVGKVLPKFLIATSEFQTSDLLNLVAPAPLKLGKCLSE